MAREKTALNTDLSSAGKSRRKSTGMHGTESKTSRGSISKLKKDEYLSGSTEMMVSVDRCRMFPYNDRIYEGLNIENCKSLIDDIQKNTQLQAVVARKDPTGEKDYEIIFGSRRFWSCHHILSRKVKVALIEADDKLAYKIMRSENDERDNTTVYEKAVNAKQVITEVYSGSQKDYCIENDINEKTLSTWMAVADIDPVVKTAIPDFYQVTVKQAMLLRSVMNKYKKSEKAVQEKARELAGGELSTASVFKELIFAGRQAIKPKTKSASENEYQIAGIQKALVIKKSSNGAVTIKVSNNVSDHGEAVLKVISKFFVNN